jgi:hypothetical protein
LNTRFKDQQCVVIETSVEVADKVKGWLGLFMFWAGIPLALIAVVLAILGFRTYNDFESKVASAEKQVEDVSKAAISTAESAREKAADVSNSLARIRAEIESSRQELSGLRSAAKAIGGQYGQLQTDVARYKQVDKKIEEVQRQLTEVKGQVVDLGSRTLRAGKLVAVPVPGEPSGFSLGNLGCGPSLLEGSKVAYCARTFPSRPFIFLSQLTSGGDVRTVASISPEGFQDASVAPKPTCTAEGRGTFYVEKGAAGVADVPFLCAKKSDSVYGWIRIGVIP